MKGKMNLPVVNGRFYTVYGGPYRQRPMNIAGFDTLGVKMAAEINAACDVDLPVKDFSIPDYEQAENALVETIKRIHTGHPVYIGCMGGIGRTGLMLALLAKAYGVEAPVAYVRSQYFGHAVETAQQQEFIRNFVVPIEAQRMIKWCRFWARIGGWLGGVNAMTLSEEPDD